MMKKRLIFTILLALLTCSCMFGACDCLGRNPNLPNLATPNITLNQDVAVWDLDPNAIGYKVSLNGIITRVDSSTTSYQLSLGDEIRVQALADGKAFNHSDWSTTLTYGSGSLEQEAIPYDDTEVRFQSIGTSYYENENGIRSAQITVETYSSAEIAYDKLELVVVGGGVEYTNVNFTGKDTIVELKNNTTYIPKVYFYLNDKLYYLSFTIKTPPLEESIEFGVANSYTFKTDSVLGFDLTLYEHTPNIKDLTVKVWGEDSSNYKTYSVFTNGFVAQDIYYLLIEDAANIAFEDSLYYSITATVDKNDGSDIKEITVVEEDFVYLENLNNVNASVTLTEIADGEYEILVENDT
ncbi:MAG: hypothetical protein J6C97_02115, partial [Clostridia bacterium]|nr:hypothetical protein [Clostridia bacterium]